MQQYVMGAAWLQSSLSERPGHPGGHQVEPETGVCPCLEKN